MQKYKRTTAMLQIRCVNNHITKSFPEGASLLDVYESFKNDFR